MLQYQQLYHLISVLKLKSKVYMQVYVALCDRMEYQELNTESA